MFFSGDRTVSLNNTEHQVDFKSHQWFGATVRSHGDTILVREPSRSWGRFRGLGFEGVKFLLCSTLWPLSVFVLIRLLFRLIALVVTSVESLDTLLQMYQWPHYRPPPPSSLGYCYSSGKRFSLRSSTCHSVPRSPISVWTLSFLLLFPSRQACAPLYSWRTEKDVAHMDPTGTCYLSVHNFTKFVEYAPCRTGKRLRYEPRTRYLTTS